VMPAAASFAPVDLATKIQFEPSVVIVLLGAATLYAWGIHRLAGKGRPWPRSRSIPFFVGLLTIAFALLSGLAAPQFSFTCHAVEDVLVGMVAPILLCLGAPITLTMESGRRRTRTRTLNVLNSRVAKIVGNPTSLWVLYGGSFFVFYLTGLYRETTRHPWGGELVHLEFIVVGFLFFLPVVGTDPAPSRPAFGGRLIDVFLALPIFTILGMCVISEQKPLAAGMAIGDMQTGGGIVWTAGTFVGILGAALVLYRWMKSEEREAIRRDSELDARLAATATSIVPTN
jgi:putative membrane protein